MLEVAQQRVVLAQRRRCARAHLLLVAPHLALLRVRCSEHVLERPVVAQQLGCRLRADAGRAGDPVGGVAAQRDQVGHERRFDAVALANLRRSKLAGAAALAQLEHGDLLADRAIQVAIACHQQRAPAGGLLGARVGEHHVVGLERVAAGDMPAEACQQRRCTLPLPRQLARHRIAMRVVGRVELDAILRLLGAEAGDDGAQRLRARA